MKQSVQTVSILVFVDLALEVRYRTAWNADLRICFNPCFRGSGSRRPYHRLYSANESKVSILVFVDLALEAHMAICAGKYLSLFQSLFSWIWLSKISLQCNYYVSGYKVSILVFVDLALED